MKKRLTTLNCAARKTRRIYREPKSQIHHLDGLSRFKVHQILVPTDFSATAKRALQYARPLARRLHAELVLLHVVPPLICPADYGYGPVLRQIPNEDEVKATMRHLRSMARWYGRGSWRAKALVRSGVAPDEIIRAARHLKTDLIVIGESRAKGLGESTAEITIRGAPCPVLVVRESGPELLKPGKDGL